MVDFDKLDRTIHERGRLAIMTLLATRPEWAFQDLKKELQLSDGNLVSHLRSLAKAGHIDSFKVKEDGNRPRTSYQLTRSGRKAFEGYLEVLADIVRVTSATPAPVATVV